MMPYLRKLTAAVMVIVTLGSVAALHVSAQESDSTNLQLYAQSAVLMDAGSGRILYEKNGYEIRPMASTTKIMTCILALEYGNLEDYVQVSSYAACMPKVKLGMQSGEYYKLKDLLYSLMLESHNDSAVAIAEHIGGSVEGFANMMNQKARDIGCFDTYFVTPNGLDATAVTENGETKVHSTTAADLAKIMAYCITGSPKKDEFLVITRENNYSFNNYRETENGYTSGNRNFFCSNHNAFLSMMDGALSGKTGFTGNAGYCYVGALQRGERTYIVALLACGWPNNKSYKWSDTKKLMNYGVENYTYHPISEVSAAKDSFLPIEVKNGQTKRIGETAYVPVVVVKKDEREKISGVLLREGEKIDVICKRENALEAPVATGTEVGSISYKVLGEVYRVEYLVTSQDIEAVDFIWCLKQIWKYYSNYNMIT